MLVRSNIQSVTIAALALLLICLSGASYAQQYKKVQNLPNFDRRTTHFGFTLAINNTNFIYSSDLTASDSLISMETNGSGGFNIGIVSDLHLNRLMSLRFLPSISFGERTIDYIFENEPRNNYETKRIESTLLDFPLNLKLRSERDNNFAAYVIGGAKYSLDLASQHDVENGVAPESQVVKLEQHSFSWEIGAGTDFFLEYFKFSMELKLSTGFHNILIQDNTVWSAPIQKLRPRMILLSFHFEG